MAGALDTVRRMLEGHSLPVSSSQRLGALSRAMKQNISPEDLLVLHAGPRPIERLFDSRGLYGTTDPKIANYYANMWGRYLTPLVVPRSKVIENLTEPRWTQRDMQDATEQNKVLSYDSYLDAVPKNWSGRWFDPDQGFSLGYHNQVYAPRQDALTPYFSKYVHGGQV